MVSREDAFAGAEMIIKVKEPLLISYNCSIVLKEV